MIEKERDVSNPWSEIIEDENVLIETSQILNILVETEKKIKAQSRRKVNVNFFYRGESEDYKKTRLIPSVLRNNDEKKEYFDALTHFPQEFSDLSSLSRLAKMQHYTYPTRLLDLTTNPLVALWFACSDYSRYAETINLKEKDGYFYVIAVHEDGVLTHDSDRALLLSCLAKLDDITEKPALIYLIDFLAITNDVESICLTNDLINSYKKDEEYKTNKILQDGICIFEKFIGEVMRECPAFATYRTEVTDLLSTFIVRPQIETERLKKQEGIFAIFGLQSPLYNNSFIYKISRFRIPKESKKQIIIELDKLGINEATLFGDIESRANYNRFKRRIKASK